MNEQNLSQWFDLAEQKPWEVGVYEVENKSKKHPNLRIYSYWNGYRFGWVEQFPWLAEMQGHNASIRTEIKWRGLSTKPEVKKKQGNRKVTRYVVIDRGGFIDKPVAVFSSKKLAEEYGSKLFAATVKTIRFRTPE